MKKTLRISVLTLLSALLAACAIERRDPNDPDVALSFQPAMYMQMDGEWQGDYPEDRPFGVWAWSLDADKEWGSDSASAEVFLENEEISPSSLGLWCSQTPVLWPPRDRNLTFIAGSPYSRVDACSKENGIEFRDVDLTCDRTDLLYTVLQTDLNKISGGGNVTMPFSHALCQVSFRVKNRGTVSEKEQIRIRKIGLSSVLCKGSFRSLPEPFWTTEDQTCDLTFFEGDFLSDILPTDIGQSFLVIPQKLDTTVDVVYEYHTAAGTYITCHSSCPLTASLLPGRRYIYTLTAGIDDVKFMTEVIVH
ncbi:MAG: fimbrillin family protein [Candidatus Cryptobacteroides sp.]